MKFIVFIFSVIAVLVILSAFLFFYKWLRRKTNQPCIGFESFLIKMLKQQDYVYIDGRVLCFSHFTREGESIDLLKPPTNDNTTVEGDLAFNKPIGLGYIIYPPSALAGSKFIFGEYGLKWAASSEWAHKAHEIIKKTKVQ